MIREFSPDALAIMELASQLDIDIARKMYRAVPAMRDQPAPVHAHMREMDMTADSDSFGAASDGLPLYEGRMVDAFDHRAKAYVSGRARAAEWIDLAFDNSSKAIRPQWYVAPSDVPKKVEGRHLRYRLGYCNIGSPTNERTLVACLIPKNSICGNKVPTVEFSPGHEWAYMLWLAAANSFCVDFLARKKVSLTITNTILDSLPLPKSLPDSWVLRHIVVLAARLTCVGPEMADYWGVLAAQGWVSADKGPELLATDARLTAIAELEAFVALGVYGLSQEDLEFVLGTFPTLERRDRERFGEYRTRRLVLERYAALATAIATRTPYTSPLSPPPASPLAAHPERP